jgi:hypothetical protein
MNFKEILDSYFFVPNNTQEYFCIHEPYYPKFLRFSFVQKFHMNFKVGTVSINVDVVIFASSRQMGSGVVIRTTMKSI